MKKILIISTLVVFLTACNAQTESQVTDTLSNEPLDQESWLTLNADLLGGGDFTILTPSKWSFEQGVGTDSQVGTISGDGITLKFAYGMHTGNPVDATGSGEKLKAQNEIIDGLEAVILTPKVTGDGEVALYFETLDPDSSESDSSEGVQILDEEHFLLFGENLTADQEELVLQIFRTIQFK